MIEIVAPWSLLKTREQRVRVRIQGVDVALETCAWNAEAAADFSKADAEKEAQLEADFAERRQNLLSSDSERAHWLSLCITALLGKADVSIQGVKVRLEDTASFKGGPHAETPPACEMGVELDALDLLADPGVPPPLLPICAASLTRAL